MAYITHKNTSGKGARTKTSGYPRPRTGPATIVKKPRWVPRTGAPSTMTARNFTRPSADAKHAPSPFPQKPPYRPNNRATPTVGVMPSRSVSGRYGFLPKDAPKGSFVKKKWVSKTTASRTARPVSKFNKPKPSKTAFASYSPKRETTPVVPRNAGTTGQASWGAVASWYDKHLTASNTYHEKVILPNISRLVDAQKDDVIIDLACGEGYFTRALAQSGATVLGRDISPELIALAQKKAVGGHAGNYKTENAENLKEFPDAHFDKALIVLAIQNIEQVHKVFSEVARTLKRGGTFHVVMNHPAFRIPKQSSWAYDEKARAQYRRVDQYLSETRAAIDMHPGMKNSPQTISFHRSLQYYMKALFKAGFAVDRFEEWISHKASDSGPRAEAENRARKEIPLFLYLRARKT